MAMLESTLPVCLAAVLMLLPPGAAAQRARDVDPNCPLPGATPLPVQLSAGGATVMSVKNPGAKPCPGGQCQMTVEVQSYTSAAGAAACCVRAEYGAFEVRKATKDVVLRWNLTAKDANSYVFNPPDGVTIIAPPPNPGDFGTPTVQPQGQWFKLPSLNGRAQTFSYGFTIFRHNPDGSYLRCDPNDPLIVNQGQ